MPIEISFKDGRRGIVEPSAQAGQGAVLARLDDGTPVLVPEDVIQVEEGGHYHVPFGLNDLEAQSAARRQSADTLVVPVLVEDLRVERREQETGRLRIHKTVHEREEVVDEPVMQEEALVERVPVNRVVDGPVPVRYEGETMIVPLLEEVLVVEKRLMLKEELHIVKRSSTGRSSQRVTLRREEATVERVEPQSA